MTIKELLRSALTDGSKAHHAVLEDKLKFEISYCSNEDVKYILSINSFQVEEQAKGFSLFESFQSHDFVETESLYPPTYRKRHDDYTLMTFFENVLIKGNSRPLLNFSMDNMNGSREHKIISKVENGKVILELIVELNSGGIHPKGKLVPIRI